MADKKAIQAAVRAEAERRSPRKKRRRRRSSAIAGIKDSCAGYFVFWCSTVRARPMEDHG